MRIDHIVIAVEALETAMRRYEKLGFTVSPGGEHPDFGSRNALIPLADGSYIELVTFDDERPLEQSLAQQRFARWRARNGLADWVLSSDRIDEEVARLKGGGQAWAEPARGHRIRPDGVEVAWRCAFPEDQALPFLITDLTPHELRVLPGAAREHENEARGIAELVIATPTLAALAPRYELLLDEAGRPREAEWEESEALCWTLGEARVVLVAPVGPSSPLHDGPTGPVALSLHRGEMEPPLRLDGPW